MPALFEQLQIARFSFAERMQLIGEIWDSVSEEVEASPLPPELCEELDRRIAAHRANPDSAIPWEEVQRRVRERLQKR
ncbi:MAG: addiction module protein [Gemmataceae bacterium]|nr:addiction module protein [Planctomycetia bacterium]MBX3397456.1 addiction module protein [Gemmataceae bacterium]